MAASFGNDFTENSSKEKESNPFSFSNFLDSKSSPANDEGNSSVLDLEKTNNDAVNKLVENNVKEGNPFSFQSFNASIPNRNISKKLQIVDDDGKDELSNGTQLPSKQDQGNESDSDWDEISKSPQSDSYLIGSEDAHLIKIEQLCEENESLRNKLSKVKEEFLEYRRTANKRVTGLQKELQKVRKKEADETQDLENVVRMVEENLQTTTARATKAESTVTRLKEEMKFLKEENVPKVRYEKLVYEHKHLLNIVQEKSKNIAQLMRTAAEKTEPHVKQLQSGISSLRFFAQQFDDIVKVTEIPSEKDIGDDVT